MGCEGWVGWGVRGGEESGVWSVRGGEWDGVWGEESGMGCEGRRVGWGVRGGEVSLYVYSANTSLSLLLLFAAN